MEHPYCCMLTCVNTVMFLLILAKTDLTMKKKFQLGNCFKFIKLKCDYVWRMFFGCGTCSWQAANSVPVYNCKTVFWENISRQKHDSMGLRVLSLKIKSLFILIKTDQCLDMLLVSWFDLRVMLSHTVIMSHIPEMLIKLI